MKKIFQYRNNQTLLLTSKLVSSIKNTTKTQCGNTSHCFSEKSKNNNLHNNNSNGQLSKTYTIKQFSTITKDSINKTNTIKNDNKEINDNTKPDVSDIIENEDDDENTIENKFPYYIPEKINFREIETKETTMRITENHYFNQLKYLMNNNNDINELIKHKEDSYLLEQLSQQSNLSANNLNHWITYPTKLDSTELSLNKIQQLIITDIINRIKINKNENIIHNNIKISISNNKKESINSSKLKTLKDDLLRLGLLFNTKSFKAESGYNADLNNKNNYYKGILTLLKLYKNKLLETGHKTVFCDLNNNVILESKNDVDVITEMSTSAYVKFKINKDAVGELVNNGEYSIPDYFIDRNAAAKVKTNSSSSNNINTNKSRNRNKKNDDVEDIFDEEFKKQQLKKFLLENDNCSFSIVGFMTEAWRYIGVKALEINPDADYVFFTINTTPEIEKIKQKTLKSRTLQDKPHQEIHVCSFKRLPEVIKKMNIKISSSKKSKELTELLILKGEELLKFISTTEDFLFKRKIKLIQSVEETLLESVLPSSPKINPSLANDNQSNEDPKNLIINNKITNLNFYGSGINILTPGHDKIDERICLENGITDNKGYLNMNNECSGLEVFFPRKINNEYILNQLSKKKALLIESSHLHEKLISKKNQSEVIVKTIPILKIRVSKTIKKGLMKEIRKIKMIPDGKFENKNKKILKNSYEIPEEASFYKNIVEEIDLINDWNVCDIKKNGYETNYDDMFDDNDNSIDKDEDNDNEGFSADDFHKEKQVDEDFSNNQDDMLLPIVINSTTNEIVFNEKIIKNILMCMEDEKITWRELSLDKIAELINLTIIKKDDISNNNEDDIIEPISPNSIIKGEYYFDSNFIEAVDWLSTQEDLIKEISEFSSLNKEKFNDNNTNKDDTNEKEDINITSLIKKREITDLISMIKYLNNQKKGKKSFTTVNDFLNDIFPKENVLKELNDKLLHISNNNEENSKNEYSSEVLNLTQILKSDIIIGNKKEHYNTFLYSSILVYLLNNSLPYSTIKTLGDVLNKKGEMSPINYKDVLYGIDIFDFFKLQEEHSYVKFGNKNKMSNDDINNENNDNSNVNSQEEIEKEIERDSESIVNDHHYNNFNNIEEENYSNSSFGFGADTIRIILASNDFDKDMVLIESDLIKAKQDIRSIRRMSRQFSLLWFLFKENMKEEMNKQETSESNETNKLNEDLITQMLELNNFYNSKPVDILKDELFDFDDLNIVDQWMIYNYICFLEKLESISKHTETIIFKDFLLETITFIQEYLNNYIISSLRRLNELSEEIEVLEIKEKRRLTNSSMKDSKYTKSEELVSIEKDYLRKLNILTWLSCKMMTTVLINLSPITPFNTQFIYEKLFIAEKESKNKNEFENKEINSTTTSNCNNDLIITKLKHMSSSSLKECLNLADENFNYKKIKYNYLNILRTRVKKYAIATSKFNKIPFKDLTVVLEMQSGGIEEILTINTEEELKWFFNVNEVLVYKDKSFTRNKKLHNELFKKEIKFGVPEAVENIGLNNSMLNSSNELRIKIMCYILIKTNYERPLMMKEEFKDTLFESPYETKNNNKMEHFKAEFEKINNDKNKSKTNNRSNDSNNEYGVSTDNPFGGKKHNTKSNKIPREKEKSNFIDATKFKDNRNNIKSEKPFIKNLFSNGSDEVKVKVKKDLNKNDKI